MIMKMGYYFLQPKLIDLPFAIKYLATFLRMDTLTGHAQVMGNVISAQNFFFFAISLQHVVMYPIIYVDTRDKCKP